MSNSDSCSAESILYNCLASRALLTCFAGLNPRPPSSMGWNNLSFLRRCICNILKRIQHFIFFFPFHTSISFLHFTLHFLFSVSRSIFISLSGQCYKHTHSTTFYKVNTPILLTLIIHSHFSSFHTTFQLFYLLWIRKADTHSWADAIFFHFLK